MNVTLPAQLFSTSLLLVTLTLATGCQSSRNEISPDYDRPFPVGAVTDAFWETQQTNAEAADFIFHDHEFVGETAELTPEAIHHLEQVALRIEHVPFPILVEQSEHGKNDKLDYERGKMLAVQLARLGAGDLSDRIVIGDSFATGYTAVEGEQAYLDALSSSVTQERR
ncbi:MAG: hypothetical protein MPJ24_06530 [Pirellulaceae bacterium]|nr:hypothetical protein [Pirellulaceae bacterium]